MSGAKVPATPLANDTPPSALVVNDIRKDFGTGEQDSFELILDTFADRRNGFVFVVNPAGAKSDTQIANEGRDVNTNWDAVWDVVVAKRADGKFETQIVKKVFENYADPHAKDCAMK